MVEYREVKDGVFFCSLHNEYFKNSCSKCVTLTPKFPMESVKSEKVMSKDFTSNSQVNISNSQAVHILKRRYVKRNVSNLWERFHNYGVKFDAVVDWDLLFKYEEIVMNKYTSYKRIDFPDALVKVFKSSILITLRSSKDIKHYDVKAAELKAIALITDVLKSLPKSIVPDLSNLVSLHNAFVNHPSARLFKETFNREMCVKDDEGNTILLTDNSKHHHELEYTKPNVVVDMSVRREQYEKNLIENIVDFPSVQDDKIKFIMSSMSNFSENMNRHVSVMEKIEEGIINLNNSVSSINHYPQVSRSPLDPADISSSEHRILRVKKLRGDWGW